MSVLVRDVGDTTVMARQVGGSHYVSHRIQPWDIIDEYGLGFYEGNILKYLLRRAANKQRVEDLQKAQHYIEKQLALLQQEAGDTNAD